MDLQTSVGQRSSEDLISEDREIDTNFSIDRFDSTKTYVLDNLVFCCVGCNLRKNQVRLSDIFNILKVYMKRKVNNGKKV